MLAENAPLLMAEQETGESGATARRGRAPDGDATGDRDPAEWAAPPSGFGLRL